MVLDSVTSAPQCIRQPRPRRRQCFHGNLGLFVEKQSLKIGCFGFGYWGFVHSQKNRTRRVGLQRRTNFRRLSLHLDFNLARVHKIMFTWPPSCNSAYCVCDALFKRPIMVEVFDMVFVVLFVTAGCSNPLVIKPLVHFTNEACETHKEKHAG